MEIKRAMALSVLLVTGHAAESQASSIVFSAAGANAAAILGDVNLFRNALGALNPNVVGSFGSGRREINWDGVPAMFAAPNSFPANFFNVNSPRGVVYSTPGTGFQVSGTGVGNIEFENLDPTFPSQFGVFSAPRLFTAIGSNISDANFFVPGTNIAATTSAFGAVFTDVDLANNTSLEFFDVLGASLGTFFAPAIAGNETLSFIGVQFTTERIGSVRITSGGNGDAVVMDDFIFAEPQAVPEPATLLLTSLGLGYLAKRRRATRRI